MNNNFQPLDSDFAFEDGVSQGIRITEEMRGYWRETARWTMILSTLAMVVVSGLAIGFVVTLTIIKGNSVGIAESFGVILIFAFLIGVAYKVRISLDKYSRGIRKAADQNNQNSLENAYSNLLWFFQFMGIIYWLSFILIFISVATAFSGRGGF